jgi:hypothetical protein
MPSAATKAKRAAAKAEKDAEKAVLEARLDAAVGRMQVEQPTTDAVAPPAQPPLPPGTSSTLLVESTTMTSVDEPPSPSGKQLLQPVQSSLTPRRTNIEYLLEAASPGGTIIRETYKRAAATPPGEDTEARAKRFTAERNRLHRARARLDAKMNPQPLLTTDEVDTALCVDELTRSMDRVGLGAPSLRHSHLQAYEKFVAAKKICALELVSIVDKLSLSEIYALYPCDERPEYKVTAHTSYLTDARPFHVPEQHRCACGSSLKFQCKCESYPINVVLVLEREQDGDSDGYGVDQNRQYWESQKQETAALWSEWDFLRCSITNFSPAILTRQYLPDGTLEYSSSDIIQLELLKSKARNVDAEIEALMALQRARPGPRLTYWWVGFLPKTARHHKTMHFADRLLRAYSSDILVSDSARAMSLYRHVTPSDLMRAYSEQSNDPMLE